MHVPQQPPLEAASTAAFVVADTLLEAVSRIGVPVAIIPAPLAPEHLYRCGTLTLTAEDAAGAAVEAAFAGV